jgi:MFS family permease
MVKLTKASPFSASMLLAAIAAFCTYTCMFAYRKPFTAAGFDDITLFGINYKVWLVVAQTVGYTLSKFYGIRFIAELAHQRRGRLIIGCILVAWLSLLFFAFVPPPYNILFFILNGFPLGMVYGLVFSYLEGRRVTEFLGAVLATSFIFAAGFTQSIGKYLMENFQLSAWWMPFVTGSIFILPTIVCVTLLDKTPPPTPDDIVHRTERKPMNKKERSAFIQRFLPGLLFLITAYVLLTILRDYRSNFASNIWVELGQGKDASIFTKTELPASLVILVLMSTLVLVRNNMKALLVNHFIVLIGFLLSLGATLLYSYGFLSPFAWMATLGVGLYMGYVPFNSILFDRLIASFQHVSNAGFLIYLADSFGYIGSDAILIAKSFFSLQHSWTSFYIYLVYVLSLLGIVLMVGSIIYFKRKHSSDSISGDAATDTIKSEREKEMKV